jgi:hypothetical protein
LRRADVQLLSSEDDPFPLTSLEALQMEKRVVVYRRTGTSEAVDGIAGCGVYEQHTPEAAFAALRKAVETPLDVAAVRRLNERFSLSGFAKGMNEAICAFHDESLTAAPVSTSRKKIAAIVHLFYHDLWREIGSHLANLRHLNVDLYVTLTSDKPREELDRMRRTILQAWPTAHILEMPNQGMDVGPFVEVARLIRREGRAYDLLLKLHSKKSLSVSGEAHGVQWRRALFERLAGTPTTVDRIISILEENPKVGMVGAKGMLKAKTSQDEQAGAIVNAPNMERLADKLQLSDRTQTFFVGTMFWARADDIIDPIVASGLSIGDFEEGHQPDNSRAHAMERLFACMVRSRGRTLSEFDPDVPKSIKVLKNRHAGEDIYVMAAGASNNYLDPSFFDGKCVIGVNRVFSRFPCTYVIAKEFGGAEYERQLLASGAIPVTSRWDSGNQVEAKMRPNVMSFKHPSYYFFDHVENKREAVDLSVIRKDSDHLVVSYSTITSAIHLAAYMGARNIILVGHDCGLINGKATFDGYYRDMTVSPWKHAKAYENWLGKIEDQTLQVKRRVKEEFGCNTVSLNPFVNFGLEGNTYTRDDAPTPAVSNPRTAAPRNANAQRPALLVCNGPSSKRMRVPHDLDRYTICRVNFFFLEDRPLAGGRVDHLFWAANEPAFYDHLSEVLATRRYSVTEFNCPIAPRDMKYTNGAVLDRPFFSAEQLVDHWVPISRHLNLARAQMQRPLPTTGLQALAFLAAIGHREIAIAGMDFYANPQDRYAFTVPDEIKAKLDPKHLKAGYEKNAHTLHADSTYLRLILEEFPDLKIEMLSDMPTLSALLMQRPKPQS